MRLATLLVAKTAVAQNDGTFTVIGGGLDRVQGSQLPIRVGDLALGCKLRFDEDEMGHEQTIEISLRDPESQHVVPLFGMAILVNQAAPQLSPDLRGQFHFVYSLRDVQFTSQGVHRFVVASQGEDLGSISIEVVVSEPAGESPMQTLSGALALGFGAFMRGDRDEAERVFAGLTERFPGSADAHNNLGFTLLARSDPAAALASFVTALRTGAPFTELVKANIATCHYLLGERAVAMDEFHSLLTEPLKADVAVLFGIGRRDIRLVQLRGTAQFLGLMALNEGRAALAENQLERVAIDRSLIQAGLLNRPAVAGETFLDLVEEFESDFATRETHLS